MPNSTSLLEELYFSIYPDRAREIRELRSRSRKSVKCCIFMHEWAPLNNVHMRYCKRCGKMDFSVIPLMHQLSMARRKR